MDDQMLNKLFEKFNQKYFNGKLDQVKVTWSSKMTLCAGKTYFRVRRNRELCNIRLSLPLLSQRPHADTINTLLHEMIHAYLRVTQGKKYCDIHGKDFKEHMFRINSQQGSKITIHHNFRKEVDKFRVHVYLCDGICKLQKPLFGVIRRAIKRPPGPGDGWWERHMMDCGGTFRKQENTSTINSNCISNTNSNGEIVEMVSSSNETVQKVKCSSLLLKKRVLNERDNLNTSLVNENCSRQTKLTSGEANVLSNNNKDNGNNKNTSEIVKRIKAKHSNIKQTILLSNKLKVEPFHLVSMPIDQSRNKNGNTSFIKPHLQKDLSRIKINETCKTDEAISIPSRKFHQNMCISRMIPASLEKNTRMVDGNLNPNYKQKSLVKLSLSKYINKYINSLKLQQGVISECNESSEGNSLQLLNSDKKARPPQCKENFEITNCPICGTAVHNTEYEAHIVTCFGGDLEDETFEKKDFYQTKVFSNNNNNDDTLTLDTFSPAKPCFKCGSMVLLDEIDFHLTYCIKANEDENDSSAIGIGKQINKNNNPSNELISYNLNVDNVCPTCMESIDPVNFQKHTIECLKFMKEEFA